MIMNEQVVLSLDRYNELYRDSLATKARIREIEEEWQMQLAELQEQINNCITVSKSYDNTAYVTFKLKDTILEEIILAKAEALGRPFDNTLLKEEEYCYGVLNLVTESEIIVDTQAIPF